MNIQRQVHELGGNYSCIHEIRDRWNATSSKGDWRLQ